MEGTASFARNQKAILSQSISFPARGARDDGLKKSIEAMSVKNGGGNGTKMETPFSKGVVTSGSRLYNPNRRASAGVQTKEQNTTSRASVRRTSLAAKPSTKRSLVRISTSSSLSVLVRFTLFNNIPFVQLILLFLLLVVSVYEVWFHKCNC